MLLLVEYRFLLSCPSRDISRFPAGLRCKTRLKQRNEDSGAQKRKHLHDIRGTFATKVLAGSDLTNAEIAGMMGWVPERVRTIRRVYVDEAKVAVALGERIEGAFVKHAVKHPNGPS